jgi:hypothetical protein
LYINNIFVTPEIHDIYIKRIAFSLIRVYREQMISLTANQGEQLMSQLKWPVEYMFVGMVPKWNTQAITTGGGGVYSGGNVNQWRDWHRLTKTVDAYADKQVYSETPAGAAIADLGSLVGQTMPDHYYLPVPTVDSMALTAHGITVIDWFSDKFYNQYIPYHYGGSAITTPEDPGALFINFALYPRSYQPSGHLNISRARETYIKYNSSYISSNTPAILYVVAICINFLIITDGSAMLRYST